MGKHEYHANKALEILRGNSYTAASVYYSALFTTPPSTSTAGTEVTNAVSGYTRAAVTFATAALGSIANLTAFNFPTLAAQVSVRGIGILDTSTVAAGNLLYFTTLTTIDYGVGDRPMVATGGITITESGGVAAEGDGAPDYTGAPGQTLIFTGDSTESFYADLTAAGAAPKGSAVRLVPAGSPAMSNESGWETRSDLVTGKDGSGKAIVNVFANADTNPQPGDKWWLANMPAVDIDKTIFVRVMCKFDGATPTEPKVTKFHQHPVAGFEAGASPQFTIVDGRGPYSGSYNPFTTQPNGSSLSVWLPDDGGFLDEDSAFPDGHDKGLQPQGPFPRDDWGEWRKFVFVFRPRQTGVLGSAIRDLWVTPFGSDTARLVMSVREENIGVVPEFSIEDGGGSGKQYCGIDMVTEGSIDGASLSDMMTFGGLSFAGVSAGQDWTIEWNIGDGNPLNPDTMVVWTED